MRRGAVLAVLSALLVGIVALVIAGHETDRTVSQDFGVIPNGPVLELAKGQEACQTPMGLADTTSRVAPMLGPFTAVRGPFDVELREGFPGGVVLGKATVERGPLPAGPTTVKLDRAVRGERDVALCFRNRGVDPLELIGDFDSGTGLAPPKRFAGRVLANPTRSQDDLEVDGITKYGLDVSGAFVSDQPRSALAAVPAAFRHAGEFKMWGVGAWTFWVLLAAALLLAPFAIAKALSSTAEDDCAAPGRLR